MRMLISFLFVLLTVEAMSQLDLKHPKYDALIWKDTKVATVKMSKMVVPNSATFVKAAQLIPTSKYSPAFFCRIEDQIARSSKINFKFRLGSVPYVDALEGKAYFEAVGYSRATNYYMTRMTEK